MLVVIYMFLKLYNSLKIEHNPLEFIASAHTGDQTVDEYPEISGITTARVSRIEFA